MKRSLWLLALALVSLNSCATLALHRYGYPENLQSPQNAPGQYTHQFAPDRVNYGVCNDTLYLLFGKDHAGQIDLFLTSAAVPLRWGNVQFVTSADPSAMQEWGAIPADLPIDFDCRQELLVETTQSKQYELFQSPAQVPFRNANLYAQWVTVVDRKNRRATVTDIPLQPEVELLQWAGSLWVADAKGMTRFTLDRYLADADSDGLSDVLEGILGTDPHSKDTDGDGTLDNLDAQPQAQARELTAEEISWRLKIEKALSMLPRPEVDVAYVNVVAPGLVPFEVTLPPHLRVVWNAKGWRGESVTP